MTATPVSGLSEEDIALVERVFGWPRADIAAPFWGVRSDMVSRLLDAARSEGSLQKMQTSRRPEVRPVAGEVERERIARIIDPKAWAKFDRHYPYAEHIPRETGIGWCMYLTGSLAKADAILSALSHTVVGGGDSGSLLAATRTGSGPTQGAAGGPEGVDRGGDARPGLARRQRVQRDGRGAASGPRNAEKARPAPEGTERATASSRSEAVIRAAWRITPAEP